MTIAPIIRTVQVAVPPQRAFDLFAGHMGRWWHETHHIAARPFADIVVEPCEGGRWYERDAEGGETQWGKVLDWDPPHRLLLGWQLRSDFSFDPDFLTELELRFEPAEGGTQVTLEHRDLHLFGEAAGRMGPAMDEGWGMLLGLYRDYLAKETV